MAIRSADDLKIRFETGDVPSANDFADLIDTALVHTQAVETAQALRDAGTPDTPVASAMTLGAVTAEDLGGGLWLWDPDSVAVDNLGTVLCPTGHTSQGRWVRKFEKPGIWHVKWFGAKGDGVTDCGPPVNACGHAAYDAGGGTVLFEEGQKYVADPPFVYAFSGLHYDFNYSNAVPRGPTAQLHGFFSNANYQLLAEEAGLDSRAWGYDLDLPGTPSYQDESRPLDPASPSYPAGVSVLKMKSEAHGLMAGDAIMIGSGAHGIYDDITQTWSYDLNSYQHGWREISKIRSVDGAYITLVKPTAYPHALLVPDAYAPGESQWGAEAYFVVTKLPPYLLVEDIKVSRLRGHMTAADQSGWPSVDRLYWFGIAWSLDVVWEDCRLHADDDLPWKMRQYHQNKNGLTMRDCRFSGGGFALVEGTDQCSVNVQYDNCQWLGPIDAEMYVHSGESSANVKYNNCVLACISESTVFNALNSLPNFTVCFNVEYNNCTLLNENCGQRALDMPFFGNVKYNKCWIANSGPGANVNTLSIQDEGVDITFDTCVFEFDTATWNTISNFKSGRFVNNTFRVGNDIGSVNPVGINAATAMLASETLVLHGNFGIGDPVKVRQGTALAQYVSGGAGAVTISTTRQALELPGTSDLTARLALGDCGGSLELRRVRVQVEVDALAVTTGNVLYSAAVYDDIGSVYAVTDQIFDAATITPGTPEVLLSIVFQTPRRCGPLTLLLTRKGSHALDTCSATLLATALEMRSARQDTTAWS